MLDSLPLELLYEISGWVIAEYIDELIGGNLKYPPPRVAEEGNSQDASTTGEETPRGSASEAHEHRGKWEDTGLDVGSKRAPLLDEHMDPALNTHNPALALLQTSARIRRAALMVLSDALGIPVLNDGIGR